MSPRRVYFLKLFSYSENDEREDLCVYLDHCVSTSLFGNILVHQSCRRDFEIFAPHWKCNVNLDAIIFIKIKL